MACPKKPSETRPTVDFLYYWERDLIRNQVFEDNVPLCVWCHVKLGDYMSQRPFTMDHIISRRAGGRYHPENLALSCNECNNDREDLTVLGYMLKRAAREARRDL